MLSHRKIRLENDRQILLDFHCRINYESDSPWARKVAFEIYRDRWLKTSQPQIYLDDLLNSTLDKRTIAEIWEDGNKIVGYLWVKFTDIADYNFIIAQIEDIAVALEYQRRGIATLMLEHTEDLAWVSGAAILRSGTDIENQISQQLHSNKGFQVYRVEFEKVLKNPIPD